MLSLVKDGETQLLKFLCTRSTTKFNVSELAEKTGLSKTWVSEKLDKFNKEGIIELEEHRGRKNAIFNRDNEEVKRLKQIINLEELRKSGIIGKIIEKYSYPEAIVLFGSFAKGEDTENSDIDIAVITSNKAEIEEEIMKRKVSIHEFKSKNIPNNMLETLANGLILYGYLSIK